MAHFFSSSSPNNSSSRNNNHNNNNNPSCFPVLDLFKRLVNAGSLAMKQEKDHMMALVESERSKMEQWRNETFSNNNNNNNNTTTRRAKRDKQKEKEKEGEIVFLKQQEKEETIGKEAEDDETLDNTSSGSSLSDSSPPASSAIAAPTASSDPQVASSDVQQEEEEEVEQQPQPQPQQQLDPLSAIQQELQAIEDEILEEELLKEEPKPTILKKQAKSPSVFGLNVVMESDDEMLEEEPDYDEASTSDVVLEESSTGSIIHKSTIRWSDDEKEDVSVTVHEVECLKDNTDMWWQDAEFTTIKQGVNETIRFCKSYNRNQVELLEDILRCDCLEDDDLMNDLLQDLLQSSGSSDSSFTRGLEGKLSNLMEKYKKRHNRKVLSTQQKLSKTKNTHSEESIERLREESLERSQTLSSFARRMGQFDEMVAKKAQTTRKSLWDI